MDAGRMITSAHFSILLNGVPTSFFPSFKGLQQGYLLCPSLLTLVVGALGHFISKGIEGWLFKAIFDLGISLSLCRYLEADMNGLHNLRLSKVLRWLGLKVNFNKSGFSGIRFYLCRKGGHGRMSLGAFPWFVYFITSTSREPEALSFVTLNWDVSEKISLMRKWALILVGRLH